MSPNCYISGSLLGRLSWQQAAQAAPRRCGAVKVAHTRTSARRYVPAMLGASDGWAAGRRAGWWAAVSPSSRREFGCQRAATGVCWGPENAKPRTRCSCIFNPHRQIYFYHPIKCDISSSLAHWMQLWHTARTERDPQDKKQPTHALTETGGAKINRSHSPRMRRVTKQIRSVISQGGTVSEEKKKKNEISTAAVI